MLSCSQCGAPNNENDTLCHACGKALRTGSLIDTPRINTNTTPQTQQPRTDSNQRVFPNRKLVAGIIAISCVVLALIAYAISPVISSMMVPELTDETILSELNMYGSSEMFTDSSWSSNTGYQQVDAEVTDRTENDQVNQQEDDAVPAQTIEVDSTFENTSFRAIVHYYINYVYQNEEWVSNGISSEVTSITPISGIDDTAITDNIASIISAIDQSPGIGSDGNSAYLSDLYQSDYSVEVVDNATDANGGTVSLTISTKQGILEHHGNLQVDFAWSGDDWVITQATADSAAYLDDYSSLKGTWKGTLQKNKSYRESCYGGKDQPLVFEVTQVDSTTKTMTMNISLLIHNHKYLEQSASESTQGDTYYTISDVTVDFSNLTSSGTIYDSQIWKKGSTASYFIQISMEINNQGEISATTKTGQYTHAGAGTLWEFYDTYTMTKE